LLPKKCTSSIRTGSSLETKEPCCPFSSVARKMSWAANRETTRVEDVAYSLLGIFEVNMPLFMEKGKELLFDFRKRS
jgi:hypothetical protein